MVRKSSSPSLGPFVAAGAVVNPTHFDFGCWGVSHSVGECESLGSLGVAFFSLGGIGCQGFGCFMGVGWVAVWLGSLPLPPLPSPLCA